MNVYLQVNLALAASFACFWLLLRLSRVLRLRTRHQTLLRSGQLLILVAILFPIALHLLPLRALPAIDFTLRPAQDSSAQVQKYSVQATRAVADSRDGRAEAGATTAALSALRWFHENRSHSSFWLALWFGGFVSVSCRFAFNLTRLRRLVSDSIIIRRLGGVCVAISERTSIPCSVRFFRVMWVVLPLSIVANRRDFQLALGHELQHHRQWDTAWALFIEILCCLFYINPAIYLWKKEIVELQEFACDENLLKRRPFSMRDYGHCLLRVAEAALEARHGLAGITCMAVGAGRPDYLKSFLRRRVEMMFLCSRPRRGLGAGIAVLGVLFTVVVALGAEQSARYVQRERDQSPNAGVVTVNPEIQRIAERALNNAVAAMQAAEGFAIVADPMTGRVLAVANVDTKGEKSGTWSLSRRLEPASLSKVLVAAHGIDQQRITPAERHSCENGTYRFAGQTYRDWKQEGWDSLTTAETIAVSSNICAIKLGQKLGAEGLQTMLETFGFGPEGTASDFPTALSGTLPMDADLARASIVPFLSLGFGYSSTPIEMLQAFGAIANGGELLQPLQADAPGAARKVIRRALSPSTAEEMKKILRSVVTDGTAKGRAQSQLYTTAGKTATGYSVDVRSISRNGNNSKADVAQFIGFAPVSSPRVEVYVGIIDPRVRSQTGAHGSEHAAPVFREIVDAVLKHMSVAPDMPRG